MIFPYRRYTIDPIYSEETTLYRPAIPIQISTSSGQTNTTALLDTGSDATLLPRAVAETIGVTLNNTKTLSVVGIAGQKVIITPALITLTITQGEDSLTWSTTVGFIDSPNPDYEQAILGHLGCLQFFTVSFDSQIHEIEMVPNEKFPEL